MANKKGKGKGGRKGKYESHVKPFFEDIEKWLNQGATEKQIAENLGVAYSSWNDYKTKYPEFSEILKKKRTGLIGDLKGALYKRALGYDYEEVTTIAGQEKGKQFQRVEKRKKHMPPDVAAINLALKNLDDEWHNDDMKTMQMKAKELELKEKRAEAETW